MDNILSCPQTEEETEECATRAGFQSGFCYLIIGLREGDSGFALSVNCFLKQTTETKNTKKHFSLKRDKINPSLYVRSPGGREQGMTNWLQLGMVQNKHFIEKSPFPPFHKSCAIWQTGLWGRVIAESFYAHEFKLSDDSVSFVSLMQFKNPTCP